MSIAVPKGTKISCPNCRIVFGIANTDLDIGDQVQAGSFDWILPYEDGELMSCKECHTPYFDAYSGSIHTSEGWTP